MIYEIKEDFLKNCKFGRLLALDIGTKKIGIAITDENRTFSLPSDTLIRKETSKDIEYIINTINKKKVVGIIVGLPLSFNENETNSSKYIRNFIKNLSTKINIPIFYQDERLTSFEAENLMKNYINIEKSKKNVDKIAASYILESFLEI